MRLLNWGIVIGVMVVLAGVSILFRTMFRVELPLFRTFIGLVVILIGVRFVLHAWMPVREAPASDLSAALKPTGSGSIGLKYDVLFSEGLVDLTKLPPLKHDLNVEVNVIFGAARVRLDPEVPFDLHASAAFGEVRLPDRRGVSFGDLRASSPDGARGPRIYLKVSAVFASCQVEEITPLLSARPGAPGAVGMTASP